MHLRGVVLPDGVSRDVWVADGLISFDPVEGARTLVGDGFLVPGLVDAHCHPAIVPGGPATVDEAIAAARADRDAGTLLIRDCGQPIDTRSLQARVDLPKIIRAGRHLALPKRYIPGLGLELSSPDELPAAVAEQAADGDAWVKLVGDWIDRSAGDLAPLWPDDVLTEAIKVAHEAGARVTAHVFGEAALPGLLNAGIDCLEHGTGLSAEQLAEMARHGTALVPTLINIENFPGIAAAAEKYPTYARHMRDLYASCYPRVGAAREAGIPIFAGTDAGSTIAHGRIADEIDALKRIGMTPTEALGAASWTAREWLGRPGIEHGASADLICYADDPRSGAEVINNPAHVILRGRIF